MNDILNTNIRGLDFSLLLALDALYEERSVTRAADRLSLTQPTVSGMLNRLRNLLGDELYVRTSHGVTPTPRAEALALPVKEVIASTQALFEATTFDPNHSEFEVRLCGTDYVNRTLFGELAGAIVKKAPKAKVSLIKLAASDLDQKRLQHEIDILFLTQDPEDPESNGYALYHDSLVCVSSYNNHKDGENVSLEELCDLSHVILAPFGAAVSERLASALRSRGLKRNIAMTVPDFSSVFRAMRYSELIAFLPSKMVRQYPGRLKQLQVGLNIPAASVVARWHARMEDDPRHKWIREQMLETAAKLNDRTD